jgi:hypothetical protein
VIRTSAAQSRVTLLLARFRFHLHTAGAAGETLLCEEIAPPVARYFIKSHKKRGNTGHNERVPFEGRGPPPRPNKARTASIIIPDIDHGETRKIFSFSVSSVAKISTRGQNDFRLDSPAVQVFENKAKPEATATAPVESPTPLPSLHRSNPSRRSNAPHWV